MTKYQKLNTEIEKLKFFFKNSIAFENYKVNKYKLGVKVTTPLIRRYYELDTTTNIILEYPFLENGRIGQCSGEILLYKFVENLKRHHDLLQ